MSEQEPRAEAACCVQSVPWPPCAAQPNSPGPEPAPRLGPPVLQVSGQFQQGQPGSAAALSSSHPFWHKASLTLVWITRCSSFSPSPGQQGRRISPHHCSHSAYRWFENMPMKVGVPYTFGCKDQAPFQDTVSHGS